MGLFYMPAEVLFATHQLFCYSSQGLDGQTEEVMYR